jgi:hypothetical protein
MKTQEKRKNKASIMLSKPTILKGKHSESDIFFRSSDALVMLKPEQIQAYRQTLRDPEIFKQLQDELLKVSCEL